MRILFLVLLLPAAASAQVSIGEKGFSFQAADHLFALRIRGQLDADGRAYLENQSLPLNDTFELRRVRPILEATFVDLIDVRIAPDFGEGKVQLIDAYAEARFFPWLKIRAGKFKPPVSLEQLQSTEHARFIELGLPVALAPNRDVGVQLGGEIASGAVTWQIGVFNGVPDGVNGGDVDVNDAKDYIGRVFLHPLRPLKIEWLDNLGVGVAGSWGRQRGTAAAPQLPTIKSSGQQTFFSYLADPTADPAKTPIAQGERWRVAPQLYWYAGPLGIMGEWVHSQQTVVKGATSASLGFDAFDVEVTFAVTGEKEGWEGLSPKRPFSWSKRQFGALEVGLRYGEIWIDVNAFPIYADPAKSARFVRGIGGLVSWYLNRNARFSMSFDRSEFIGGAAGGKDREPENALFGRLHVGF